MSLIAMYQGVTDEKLVHKAILLRDATTLKTLYCRMHSDLLIVESDDISTPKVSYKISSDGKYYTCNGGTYDGEFMPIKTLIDGVFVTKIAENAFYNNISFSTLILPERLETLGDKCFYSCRKLNSMVFPKTLQHIGNYAFHDCSRLTSVTIPNGVKTIGNYAFDLCSSLTSITIPDSVTSIGDNAFRDCDNVTSATIPAMAIPSLPRESLQTVVITSGDKIEKWAFNNCPSLTSVTIPDSVTTIGDTLFIDSGKNITITFNGTEAQWNAIEKGYNWSCGNVKEVVFIKE